MYKNLYDYLAKCTARDGDRFSVTIFDASGKEPDMLRMMIHPEARDGITADFFLHADGTAEFTTML